MTQANFISFLGEITNAYQSLETKVKLKTAHNSIPKASAHLISAVSFLAIGYFAHLNTNNTLLGAGFAAGLLVSYIDPTCGNLPSLNRSALLPMDQGGSFALQKIYLISALLGKQYGLPIGFFMGNAIFHMVRENL